MLTAREFEIALLISEGLSNEEIGQRLVVEVTTVRTHLNALYKKLKLKNRVQLALWAINHRQRGEGIG